MYHGLHVCMYMAVGTTFRLRSFRPRWKKNVLKTRQNFGHDSHARYCGHARYSATIARYSATLDIRPRYSFGHGIRSAVIFGHTHEVGNTRFLIVAERGRNEHSRNVVLRYGHTYMHFWSGSVCQQGMETRRWRRRLTWHASE